MLADPADWYFAVPGVTTKAVPLWMTDEDKTIKMVEEALSLATTA